MSWTLKVPTPGIQAVPNNHLALSKRSLFVLTDIRNSSNGFNGLKFSYHDITLGHCFGTITIAIVRTAISDSGIMATPTQTPYRRTLPETSHSSPVDAEYTMFVRSPIETSALSRITDEVLGGGGNPGTKELGLKSIGDDSQWRLFQPTPKT